jgi:hypothetical protein
VSIAPLLDATAPSAKAAWLHRLANEILPGEFRNKLLELAKSYETEAARIERRGQVGGGTDNPPPD